MSLIDVVNLSFAYEGSYDDIFENVSFQIDTDWKLGFVGRNGRGKTTFLSLLLGQYEYQGIISGSVDFQYFPPAVKDKSKMTLEVLEELNPNMELWQVMKELNLLNVAEEVLYREFHTLSNGEQTKVLLASLFLKDHAFLLIDEPTNHLDSEARESTADYLNKKKGFILVSHDRKFLDNCVDHILSINKKDIEVQKGTFSSWFENKQARDRMELAQNEKLKSEVKRLEKAAKQTENWSDKVEKSKKGERVAGLRPDRGHIGRKAAKMMKRSKILETRQQDALEEKSGLLKNLESAERLKLYPLRYQTDRLAELRGISIQYGVRRICQGVSFEICRGDRICLSGKNGCGKTSIIKLLLGQDIPFHGECRIGSGLKISYVSQDTSYLTGGLKELAVKYGLDETLFKAMLRKLDLERVQFEKDISEYSAGQKKKVLLAKSLCEQAHIYIWDEPLNYIDIYSRMQLEELILSSMPTMIFVEHDEMFREKIATKIVTL